MISNAKEVKILLENFMHQPLNSLFWTKNFTDILAYIIAPSLLIFILIYSLLERLKIFDDRRINAVLSLLLALFILITDIYLKIALIIINLGSVLFISLFFLLIFGIILSNWFAKKAENYGFVFGSRFLSNFLINSPLLILLIFSSSILENFLDVGDIFFLILSIIILLTSIFFLKSSYRGDLISIILIILLSIILEIYFYQKFPEKAVLSSLALFLFLIYLTTNIAKTRHFRRFVERSGE